MNEEHRRRVIREKVARMAGAPLAALPTGFSQLDAATGGLPRGRIVEVFGASGTGKTTLALQIVAAAQRDGGAAWVDAERSFDPAYAAGLGVSIDRLAVAQPQSAEQTFEIIRRLSVSGAVDLLVVDSAAALVPEVELQLGIGKGGAGAHSRALASGLRKLATALRSSGAVVIFLNQTRARDDLETSAGGAPLKLSSAIRISLHRAGSQRIRFRVLKNKAAGPFREGHLSWKNGSGFTESP